VRIIREEGAEIVNEMCVASGGPPGRDTSLAAATQRFTLGYFRAFLRKAAWEPSTSRSCPAVFLQIDKN